MKKTDPGYKVWFRAHKRWKSTAAGQRSLKNTEKKRAHRRLLERYGLSEAEYDAMLTRQGSVCAACQRPETRPVRKDGSIRRLSVDHCHDSGKVRGLLCYGCNSALGFLDDKAEYVEKLLRYIVQTSS